MECANWIFYADVQKNRLSRHGEWRNCSEEEQHAVEKTSFRNSFSSTTTPMRAFGGREQKTSCDKDAPHRRFRATAVVLVHFPDQFVSHFDFRTDNKLWPCFFLKQATCTRNLGSKLPLYILVTNFCNKLKMFPHPNVVTEISSRRVSSVIMSGRTLCGIWSFWFCCDFFTIIE